MQLIPCFPRSATDCTKATSFLHTNGVSDAHPDVWQTPWHRAGLKEGGGHGFPLTGPHLRGREREAGTRLRGARRRRSAVRGAEGAAALSAVLNGARRLRVPLASAAALGRDLRGRAGRVGAARGHARAPRPPRDLACDTGARGTSWQSA